jgi:hypothetical protein
MPKSSKGFTWGGSYKFQINGTGMHEDTLKIKGNYRKQEKMLKLVLPTLCITYADMKFQNKIGGEQLNYPASQVYGQAHFSPAKVIVGDDIEKFTYIRGAHRVEIGPRNTTIEFPSWNDLVIPRLRLDIKKPTEAVLRVPETPISVEEPLGICVLQYADGRHIGGVKLEKRHPKWRPEDEKQLYNLWLRVIDGVNLKPIPEARVDIWHWDENTSTPYGTGGFRLDDSRYTDSAGTIYVQDRPSGELEAYSVRMPGWRVVARCLKPLAGQEVRLHMRAWPLKRDTFRYTQRVGDKPDDLVQLTGYPIDDILHMNRLNEASDLKPEMQFALPCYIATYRMEQWDTFDWVGKTFGYRDAEGLAEANGLEDVASLNSGTDIKLPDWRFFYAGDRDTLEAMDARFNLPTGSSITVGRAYHPDPRVPFGGETVAVPTPQFAETLKKRRMRKRKR